MKFNNIHKAYLARFLASFEAFGAISVPYFLDWIETDYTGIFVLQAWFVFWILVLQLPTGILADKWGRKNMLALGSLLFAVDIFIFGLTKSYAMLIVAEFIGALGFALLSGADRALIYDSLVELKKQKQASKFFARHEAAGTAGVVLGFPLGSLFVGSGIIAYPLALAFTFIISGILVSISALFYFSMEEPKRRKPKEKFIQLGITGVKTLFKNKNLRMLALNSALISGVLFFIFWLYQPLAGNAGVDIKYYGIIGAGYNLLAVYCLLNIKKIEKWFGVKNLLFYSGFIPALLFIFLAFTQNVILVLLCITIIAVFRFIRMPVLEDLINSLVASKQRATVLSAITMIEELSRLIMYPLLGILMDIQFVYGLLFVGITLLVLSIWVRVEESHLNSTS